LKKLIKSDYLARVEGEGGFVIEIRDGKVAKINLRIFEAPRLFESFLRGRSYSDVIDFAARICGICPVAYQMSSVHAIEQIFGVVVPQPVRDLRRLMYCGEWIESHSLHVFLLHGPDFFGLESAWADKQYLEILKKGLLFKKLGNELLSIIGGRPVHPVSVKVGGFYRTPERKNLLAMLPSLEAAYAESLGFIRWAAGLPFPGNEWDMEFVSLSHKDEYPMNEGSVISNKGLDLPVGHFLEDIQEYQVDYSTALHSSIKRNGTLTPFIVGPLARLNLNHDRLPPDIRQKLIECGLTLPLRETQKAIIARTVELSYAFHEAIRLIKNYEQPDKPSVGLDVCSGTGVWATEAPRGLLFHRYELDEEGNVKNCTIIPPTVQNLSHMERDIRHFIGDHPDNSADFLRKETEKLIRGYDPCISCSVHVQTISSNG
jgi:sulfhydrogenase subunit alpha